MGINTIRDQLLFGRDELGGAKARELRAKGVMLDTVKHIKKQNAEIEALKSDMGWLLQVYMIQSADKKMTMLEFHNKCEEIRAKHGMN